MKSEIQLLPPSSDIETKAVLKQLSASHRYLALLNGRCATIPNENILINTLALQEAKESSAIENIITTHDELYKAQLFESLFDNAAAKEVSRYAEALKDGFTTVRRNKIITHKIILEIQRQLEQNDAGYRRLPGTALINDRTGETVYTPPQDYTTIQKLMDNLVEFMNREEMSDVDPLIKMAIIHHRFETIHPFYDGNGRTGRIINILYMVKEDLLALPILYLSRYIIQYKNDYYKLLQQVREDGNWEPWILYMLKGVEETAKQTLHLIEGIKKLMQEYKNTIRDKLPKIYSQDLLNNLFKHPYTKIEFLEKDLTVKRKTAGKYLNLLADTGLLDKVKIGKTNFYINQPLYDFFKEGVPKTQITEPIKTVTENKEAGGHKKRKSGT
jgi:Fic family protein